jgi:sporulation protein YlmC with PRC-barrel domain
MTAAFAVMLAATVPMAYGQTTTTTTHATGAAANHMLPGQIRLTQMNGANVYDVQNQKIGDVKDIILDRNGRVAEVVLDVGAFLGMGGKLVAVGMNDIKVSFDDNNKPKFAVDLTREQLKSAQAYDLNVKNAATGSSTPPVERIR